MYTISFLLKLLDLLIISFFLTPSNFIKFDSFEETYLMKQQRSTYYLSFLLICIVSFNVYGNKTHNAESTWLIDYYFKKDVDFHKNLTEIDQFILLGNYSDAKRKIEHLKQKKLASFKMAALLCYEGNIAYNESDYQKSIDLCNESLNLISHAKNKNRYWVKAMNLKAKGLGAFNEYDQAEKLVDSAMIVARRIEDQYGLSACYYYLGSFYSDKGDFPKCVSFMEKSLEIRLKIGDEIGSAACYAFLGLSYSYMDDYLKGIELIQKSIVIRERLNDKRGLANSYLTLYKVYSEIGEFDKAMKSEFKSLSICQELKDLQCVSGRYTNIGEIYQRKGMNTNALFYHFKALELSRKLGIKNRIAQVQENIARVYFQLGQNKLANFYLDSSAVLREIIGDEIGLTTIELVRAEIHLKEKDFENAILSSNHALSAGIRMKLPHVIKEAHSLLHRAYSFQKDSKNALFHFEKFVYLRDSIFNIDQSKELLRKELEFNFAKKQAMDRLQQVKKSEKAKVESKKQKNIILFSSSALAIVTLLLGFSIWQFRLKNRSKKELESANVNLSFKNYELVEKSSIIESQSAIIQKKNMEIRDSIRYAHKIQTAVLSTPEEYKQHFSEAFVFFQPKDIVSGDFYWVTEMNENVIFATADCTGHGVPGGFMSMLGVSMLNEIITENKLLEPEIILDRLRDKVILSLKQKGITGEQQDGMDMTLCVFNRNTRKLKYATANHVLYVVRKEEDEFKLFEFKGNKHPVGIFGDVLNPFQPFEIQTKEGDVIYTFTDGFADQFGGPRGKKYKYKQLKDLLVSLQDKDLATQEQLIRESFFLWKGKLDQIDDVCVVGVKV